MLNPSLNEIVLFLCIAGVAFTPLCFHLWLLGQKDASPDQKDNAAALFVAGIFALLFLGAFCCNRETESTGNALLFASVISTVMIYKHKAKENASPEPVKPADPRKKFRLSATVFVLLAALYGFMTLFEYSPYAYLILFTFPFIQPLFIRMKHSATRMEDSSLKQAIFEQFKKNGVALEQIYLIDADQMNFPNAMIAGNGLGKGIFGRTLFLTLSLFEKLNEAEIEAVLLHEVVHFKKSHVTTRMIFGIVTFVWSVFLVLPFGFLVQDPIKVLPFTCLAIFVIQGHFMGRLVRKQEHEADVEAVKLGASSESLKSALLKVAGKNHSVKPSWITRFFTGGYPTVSERVQAIDAGEIPRDAKGFTYKKYWFAYSLFVVGYLFWSAQQADVYRNRAPANIAHLEDKNGNR